jgi:hypothetical protein
MADQLERLPLNDPNAELDREELYKAWRLAVWANARLRGEEPRETKPHLK